MNLRGTWSWFNSENTPFPHSESIKREIWLSETKSQDRVSVDLSAPNFLGDSSSQTDVVNQLTAGLDGRMWATILKQQHNTFGQPEMAWLDSLLMFDKQNWILFKLGENGLPKLRFDLLACEPAGQLWLLSRSDGILCSFDGQNTEIFRYGSHGLSSEKSLFILDFASDVQRGLLAAMGYSGIYYFDGMNWSEFESPHSAYFDNVRFKVMLLG